MSAPQNVPSIDYLSQLATFILPILDKFLVIIATIVKVSLFDGRFYL